MRLQRSIGVRGRRVQRLRGGERRGADADRMRGWRPQMPGAEHLRGQPRALRGGDPIGSRRPFGFLAVWQRLC